MTLIAAIGCSDGIVLASDSASSDLEAGTRQVTEKLKRLGNHSIMYGGSGDVGLLQKLYDALGAIPVRPSIRRYRQEIKAAVIPELKLSIEQHVAYPAQGCQYPPGALLLFAGVTNREPWILEIEKDGRDTLYGDDLGNFAAIGSGKAFAQAIFRPHLKTPRDLNLGKTFAYRVVDDAIELAVMGLSHPIHIFTIALDGTIARVAGPEMEAIKSQCELWHALEREAVGKILAPEGPAELPPAIPAPEA